MTTSRYQSLRALEQSSNRVRRSSCDDPRPGVVVANYTGAYVDRDMQPAKAKVAYFLGSGNILESKEHSGERV